MLFSLLSITYGGIGYRFFSDSQLKNLSITAVVSGIVGLVLFVSPSSKMGNNLWLVVEITNIVLSLVLGYYLVKIEEEQKDKKVVNLMLFGLFGCLGVTGLVAGLIHFRGKQIEKTELAKVQQVYERLTSNQ
jgi:hypothetical protein